MSASTVDAPASEPVLIISRTLDAPRTLVWRCYTEPAHLARFWGPHGATTPLSEVDLRVGGAWRQVMRFASGSEHSYTSIYLEIAEPERLVWRDAPDGSRFGDALPRATFITTMTLAETDGRTTVTVHVRFDSLAERDGVIERGFATIVTESSDRLETYLATLQSPAPKHEE